MKADFTDDIWIAGIQERAIGSVISGTLSVSFFTFLFFDILVPHAYYGTLMALLLVLQGSRLVFYAKSKTMERRRWVVWHDASVVAFATLWCAMITPMALQGATVPLAAMGYALLLTMGLISVSSQFFCSSTWVFAYYLTLVVLPVSWIASQLGSSLPEKIILGLAPAMFTSYQIRSRRSLLSAIQNIGGLNADFREAIDSFPGGLAVLKAGYYARANHFAEKLLGVATSGAVGQPFGFSHRACEMPTEIKSFMRGKSDVHAFDASLETPDGPREHFILLRRSERSEDTFYISWLDTEALAQAEREVVHERARSVQLVEAMNETASEINGPLAELTEQVLVRKETDIETTRTNIRRLQLAVSRLRAG